VADLDELRNAIDRVERGQELVDRQRARLAALRRKDDSYEMSRRVLRTLEEALRLMIDHRDMIARELKRNGQLTSNDSPQLQSITES
jgi:hypothetical protein